MDSWMFFFLSSPKDHDLENEALYLFNKDPNFFVHNRMDMISVLGVEQMDSLYESNSGNLDTFFQKNAEKLRADFRNSHALVVNLRQSGDARSKNKFYVVSAETWSLENINGSTGKTGWFLISALVSQGIETICFGQFS